MHIVHMKYFFKKFDITEIDCKLLFNHSTYHYADNTFLYYRLYDGMIDDEKLLFREIRRYNHFTLINNNRVIAYTKLYYIVEYDIDNIIFTVSLGTSTSQMNMVISHNIVKYGINYVNIKHYRKI